MRRFGTSIIVFCFAFALGEIAVYAQSPQGGSQRESQRGAQQTRGPSSQQGRPGGSGRGESGGSGKQTSPLLRVFDANGDGELTSQEIQAAVATLRKLDKDHDGILTAEEVRPSGARQGNASSDRGGQGRSGQSRSGQSRSGQSRGEPSQSGGQDRGGSGQAGGPQGRAGGGGRGRDPARGDASFAAQVFTLDANQDGAISQSEIPEHMHAAFKLADADKNGKLNADERLVLAGEFRRNRLNPEGDLQVKNAPVQSGGRQPQR